MRVVVEVETGPRQGGRWLLRAGDQMTFGRTEQADIIIPDDPILSSCHFRIVVDQQKCMIEDLQSTNGTFVGDKRITVQRVEDGDHVIAGNSTFSFAVDARDAYQRTNDDAHAQIRRRTDANRTTDRVPEPKVPTKEDRDQEVPDPATAEKPEPRSIPASLPDLEEYDKPLPTRPKVTPFVPPPVQHVDSAPARQDEQGRNTELAKRMEPSRHLPSDFVVQLRRGNSGLWIGVQPAPIVETLLLTELLSRSIQPLFIVDFGRTGLSATDFSVDQGNPPYLMVNLPPHAAALVSPIMMQPSDFQERQVLIEQGWGADGIIVLFTPAPLAPMTEHFQQKMKATRWGSDADRGIVGLCWSSVMQAMLQDGKSAWVAEVIEPCDAILVDAPEQPGGWMLLGDDRLPDLLTACQIPQSVEEATDEPEEKDS